MRVIGIDVGGNGGICTLDGSGEIISLIPMPKNGTSASPSDIYKHVKPLIEEGNTFAFIEKAQAMPKQGVSSMFKYGYHAGGLEMIFIALAVPYELVPPKTWQKSMFVGTEAKQPAKVRAYQAASRLAPTLDFKASERSTKPHDGMVDAFLIANYGIRKFAVVSG